MQYLRYNTDSQEVVFGIFVDSTDGNTEETGLTIENTNIKIWKAGATTLANKNSGGATHISNGIYYAVFDATDTNTLGSGKAFVHVSGALYCILEFCVLPQKVYDSMIAGSDNLEVDTIQIEGTDATDQINSACDTAISDAGVTTTRMGYVDYLANATYGLSAIETLVDEIETRLTATRAGYLDELGSANIPADIDTLLSRLTALRAGYIDNLSGGAVALASGVPCSDKTGFSLSASGVSAVQSGLSTLTAQQVWEYATRTLTVSTTGIATEAKQDEIIADIAGIITHGDANWLTPSGIGGTIAVTFNVKDDSGNNILDAVVEVWDTAGTTLKERKETNSSGNAVFNCKAEAYTIKITKAGYSFDNTSYTGTVPATVNYVMTAFVIPISPDLTKCRVWMKLVNTYSSLTVTAEAPEYLAGNNLVMGSYIGVYDAVNNLVYWDLPRGAVNLVLSIIELGFEIVVPLILDVDESELEDLI